MPPPRPGWRPPDSGTMTRRRTPPRAAAPAATLPIRARGAQTDARPIPAMDRPGRSAPSATSVVWRCQGGRRVGALLPTGAPATLADPNFSMNRARPGSDPLGAGPVRTPNPGTAIRRPQGPAPARHGTAATGRQPGSLAEPAPARSRALPVVQPLPARRPLSDIAPRKDARHEVQHVGGAHVAVAVLVDQPALHDVDLLLRLPVQYARHQARQLDRVLLVLEQLQLHRLLQPRVRVVPELLPVHRQRADVVHDHPPEIVLPALRNVELLLDRPH